MSSVGGTETTGRQARPSPLVEAPWKGGRQEGGVGKGGEGDTSRQRDRGLC